MRLTMIGVFSFRKPSMDFTSTMLPLNSAFPINARRVKATPVSPTFTWSSAVRSTLDVDRTAADQVKVGDTGVAITRLALIGNAEIDGNIVEVKSMDGFLNEKTPIIVNRITDGVIMVEKKKD